ncbi:hypothetical protein GCM10009810_12050 [Nostocoides vanveenii]|uniref:Uncharacterized protein n=2 Tax=Nostocoides vanveenii TaxID=330835 RepID=A0ABP4WFZ5_9MICO
MKPVRQAVHITGMVPADLHDLALHSFIDAIEARPSVAPLLVADCGTHVMQMGLPFGHTVETVVSMMADSGFRCRSVQLCAEGTASIDGHQVEPVMIVVRLAPLRAAVLFRPFTRTPDGVSWQPGRTVRMRPELSREAVALSALLVFSPASSN